MRIVVDVPEYLIERARKLIGRGTYRDLSSFVTAGIENQLTIEEKAVGAERLAFAGARQDVGVVAGSSLPLRAELAIPQEGIPTLGYPPRPGSAAVQQWPWGQINKLLPVKFAVRLLASSLSQAEPVVPLDEFKAEAAKKARRFGQWLEDNDNKYERRWGNRLSAGFPTGKRVERSLNRYASHFVGYHRKRDDALFGALFVFKFGNAKVEGTKLSIGLTEAGLQLARIPNPVLDNSDLSRSLGDAEIQFYLEHIRARVPGEEYAFELILRLIDEGVGGRQALNRRIRESVSLDWTDAVVNTQRAGAMARMSDLGLIEKTRNGLRVEYLTTEQGMSWLNRTT